MKKVLISISAVLIAAFGHSQNLIWGNSNLTSNGECKTIAIEHTQANETIQLGRFRYTVDFDPSSSVFNFVSAGQTDFFIQKLDANGALVWIKSIGSTGDEIPTDLFLDDLGNIYVTGTFDGTTDFDPGPAVNSLTPSGTESFVAKYDSNGSYLWANQLTNAVATGISANTAGNSIAICGYFTGTMDCVSGPSQFLLTSAGNEDMFVLNLNNSGQFQGALRFGGSGFDRMVDVTTDNLNNLVCTGYFQNVVDFDPGAGVSNLGGSGTQKGVILKLQSSGTFVWAKDFANSIPSKIKLDGNNDIYSVGTYTGTVDFDPGAGVANITSNGSTDIFAAKLNSGGTFLWVKSVGSSIANDVIGLDVDYNQVIFVGPHSQQFDMNPDAGVLNSSASSFSNIGAYAIKLALDGTFLSGLSYISTSYDVQNLGVDILDATSYLLAGFFSGTVDFDPTSNVYNLTSISNSSYLLKLDCSNGSTTNQTACGSFVWNGNTYTNSGNYTYSTTNSQGCDSTATLNLTINVLPLTTVSQSGTTFTADLGGASYQWIDCNNNNLPIMGESGPTYSPQSAGSYAVIVTNDFCSDTSSCYIVNTIGLTEVTNVTTKIFPNPVKENYNISSQVPISRVLTLDISGKVVQDTKVENSVSVNLDATKLNSGLYLLRIEFSNGMSKIERIEK